MMELTCAYILILASLVSANPYGYGVKGGASAQAESSASARAFGGVGEIPVAVPLGAAYSGSFSKSSSSSSSSSSASSSSSSSSFSYSGNGAGGLGGFGLNGGEQNNGGCSSGNCQTAGGHGKPVLSVSSLQGYNAANSAAKEGAGGLSQCQGNGCDNNSEKCASGQCRSGIQTELNPSTASNTKCKLGSCGPSLQNGEPLAEYGPNDIRVMPDSPGSAHDTKDQSDEYAKTSSTYNTAGSDCSRGKCGPTGSQKSNYGHDFENSYQSSSALDKAQTSNLNVGTNSNFHTPATHLETPKLGSKCTSGNCQPGQAGPSHETSPSSYNVPIHGSYNSDEKRPTCDGVKCENQPRGTYSSTNSNSLSTNYLSPQHSLNIGNTMTKNPPASNNPSVSNCEGSNCLGLPLSQSTGGPSFTVRPEHVNFGQSPTNIPTITNCKTPNCSPSPTYPEINTESNTPSGHVDYFKPSHGIKPSNDKLPTYTGGFGGVAGILNPNEFNAAPTGQPNHVHSSPSQNGAPSGSSPASPVGCNSPSCSGNPHSGANAQSTYGHELGSGVYTHSEKPTYSGGFGGPAGMLKPNDFSVPASVTTVPNLSHPASPSYNTQPSLNNLGTTGCKAANCGGYSPTAQTGYIGTTKPSTVISTPNEKLPLYSGGFGGPGRVYKPNEYNTHATGPSSPGYNPSNTHNTPISNSNLDCKTQNCLSSTAVANAQAQSFGVTNPSSNSPHSSLISPAYTTNYGLPSGINKPNPISTPVFVPLNSQSPSSPGSYSTSCKTANCATYPTSGVSADTNVQPGYFGVTKPNTDTNLFGSTAPQYTDNFSGPSGSLKPYDHTHIAPAGSVSSICKTPNCVNPSIPSGTTISGGKAPSGSYAKPSSNTNNPNDNLPNYSGGFGGAPGFLKPSEHKDSAVSPTLNVNNPTSIPTGISYPVACSSGNCSPHMHHGSASHSHNDASNGAHATAAAAAEANAVAYTGGFGGPPGVLKPYDEGKIGATPVGGAHIPNSETGSHSTPGANGHSTHHTLPAIVSGPTVKSGLTRAHGNIGIEASSIAASTAYAGAVANIPSSNYDKTGNINGGNPCGRSCGGGYNSGSGLDIHNGQGLPKSGYSDGLNGGRSTAGASAKSLAGAGTFGLGGSYASSSATAHASAGAYTKGGYGK